MPINPSSPWDRGRGSSTHVEAPRDPETGPPSRRVLLEQAYQSYAPAKYVVAYKIPHELGTAVKITNPIR